MNSIKYIGKQIDSIVGHSSHRLPRSSANTEDGQFGHIEPHNNVSIWTIIVAFFLLRWGFLGELVFGPQHAGKSSSRAASEDTLGPMRARRRLSSNAAKYGVSSRSVSLLSRALDWKDTERKTLVLDLDETLIHSMGREVPGMATHLVEVDHVDGISRIYFVAKRPHCDTFLSQVSQWFNVIIFTASVRSYADPMIDWVDESLGVVKRRMYRSHCVQSPLGYIKDLRTVDEDLSRVIIVDNSPVSYLWHKNNAVAIEGWISDPTDDALLHILPLLNALRYTTDVRSILCLTNGEDFQTSSDKSEPLSREVDLKA
ncbi:Nuclear envelope morphology protein 1 [Wickerhamiella sorbophila]|uniref:Nuclear envelope morphology protein 1 n=1 Tax=Wickerhamiella sorbophila TaxID=45607 RepID=A0A2T0FHE0_9ASCO|nr:Nuclear envelope morphology protein 1 [Wickerhamiella sorbophila]PRT54418.1 Nuclear envelope morphology protein 1 [Wickerhamiella sorbophila]